MQIRLTLLIAAVSLLGAVGAAGQDLGNKVQIAYSESPRPHVTATNVYRSPITAMAITITGSGTNPQRTYETLWYDSGVEFSHNPPLAVGQSYTYPVGPANEAASLQPHLWAVAFQDGESFGDPHWLAELHARRQAAYTEIATVTTLLNESLSRHEASADIISALNVERGSLRANIADPEPRIAAMFVTEWAAGNLKPPPGPAATHVNMDPQARIQGAILPWFSRWRAALQASDSSIR